MRLKRGFELLVIGQVTAYEATVALQERKFAEVTDLLTKLNGINDELHVGFEFLTEENLISNLILSIRSMVKNLEDSSNEENNIYIDIESVEHLRRSIENKLDEIGHAFRKNHEIVNKLVKKHQKDGFEYVYAIGLPKYEYFDDLTDFTKDLNFVFKTVISNKEKAKLVGFDVGSEWYLIGFDTYIAFKAFGIFVKECYKYLKRKKEDEERIEGLTVDDGTREKLVEAMKVANEVFIQDGLNKLSRLRNNGDELSPEEMSQNIKAIEIFSGLLEKNMKVDVEKQPEGNTIEPNLTLPSSDHIRNLLESSSSLFLENNNGTE